MTWSAPTRSATKSSAWVGRGLPQPQRGGGGRAAPGRILHARPGPVSFRLQHPGLFRRGLHRGSRARRANGRRDDRGDGRRRRHGHDVASTGITGEFVTEVQGLMKPGTSAVFVLDAGGDMEVILRAIRGLGGTVLKTNVHVERARLIQATLAAASSGPGA